MLQTVLSGVRFELSRQGLAAAIVSSEDAHNSEYPAAAFNRRELLCGFAGSAGTCVVTQEAALLWTDGRYWTEAAAAFDGSPWVLMKDQRGMADNVTISQWLERNVPDGDVGADADTFTISAWEDLRKTVAVVPTDGNIVDAAVKSVAEPPLAELFALDSAFAGESPQEKIARVAAEVVALGCGVTVLSALDDVAWLFNLRGSDVAFNPTFYAFAAVEATGAAHLFIDSRKLPDSVRGALPPTTTVHNYDQTVAVVSTLAAPVVCAVGEHVTSYGLLTALQRAGVKAVRAPAIVQRLKAVKNERERRGFRECHRRDGAALTRFLAWLDIEVRHGDGVTENAAAQRLEKFRAELDDFVHLSFETIAGSGANGAIIHGHATDKIIARDELFLVDSGGHYRDGTTDVTRTVCFSTASSEERTAYTRVLQGHIALNSAVFPPSVCGSRLDALARLPLWSAGLDYAHGTGHGVGCFLNVHEGPHGIGTRAMPSGGRVVRDVICSNEPGFYKDGAFGIRIENLDLVVGAGVGDGSYNTFESLTMTPLCRDLIVVDMLSASEIAWVDAYHRATQAALTPLLNRGDNTDDVALQFLRYHAQPIAE
jgi:Xaa-Pro aminopeptidase